MVWMCERGVGNLSVWMLLLPVDVLHPNRPDGHFAGEADAARAAGFDVALVDAEDHPSELT